MLFRSLCSGRWIPPRRSSRRTVAVMTQQDGSAGQGMSAIGSGKLLLYTVWHQFQLRPKLSISLLHLVCRNTVGMCSIQERDQRGEQQPAAAILFMLLLGYYTSIQRTQRRLLLADYNCFMICTYPYVCCCYVPLIMVTRN